MPVVEPVDFTPEADREGLDAYTAPARDEEVPQLVHEHDNGEHEQERQEDEEKPSKSVGETGQQCHLLDLLNSQRAAVGLARHLRC